MSLRNEAIKRSSNWQRVHQLGCVQVEGTSYCGAVRRMGVSKYYVAIMTEYGPANGESIVKWKTLSVRSREAAFPWIKKQLGKLDVS